MTPDISQAFCWLKQHPAVLNGIQRGIERDTLRVTTEGCLATTDHPKSLGAALTHRWITTDFAETLLEFVTPVYDDIDHLLAFMRDIHRDTSRKLGTELMWPLSMPCFISAQQNIQLAKYGSSNSGRFKTLYREGLKNRYGALMQTIAGVHYNFSLPVEFWQAWAGVTDEQSGKKEISAGYFGLIRNYYRFGWIIPYLFGASPAMCSSFPGGRKTTIPFEFTANGLCYLPYATSLRLSDLGYTNSSQCHPGIIFNDLSSYVAGLRQAVRTPSPEYARLGLQHAGHYLQLNTNMLQIENELYLPIRPKRVTMADERPSDALLRGGIEYVEVRSLDINPFSPIGIDAVQVRFLDLFLIWCVLADSPPMSHDELLGTRQNWNRVILEGRRPGQTLAVGCDGRREPLIKIGKALFEDLLQVARVLDTAGSQQYQEVCDHLVTFFDDPTLTFSARILQSMKDDGFAGTGLRLASHYREIFQKEPLEFLTETQLLLEQNSSWKKLHDLECSDTLSFEQYLKIHAGQ